MGAAEQAEEQRSPLGHRGECREPQRSATYDLASRESRNRGRSAPRRLREIIQIHRGGLAPAARDIIRFLDGGCNSGAAALGSALTPKTKPFQAPPPRAPTTSREPNPRVC